jgi:ATP-dependent helicase/nuclease subunit A
MSTPLIRDALDPRRSAVVEACAGSGKTWLLVSRVIRLLLQGAAPSEILAITFTRKAAQEMQARLAQWLRFLATGTEDEVRDFLAQRAMTESEIDAALPRARTLFEEVLRAQPSVTINTFHGWFLEIVKRAPLASGSAGSVSLVEQASALLDEAWQSLANELSRAPESESATHLNTLFRDYGLLKTRGLLRNFVYRRAEWLAYVKGADDPIALACARLQAELGVDPEGDPIGEFFAHGGEGEAAFMADLLGAGTEKQQAEADRLHRNGRSDAEYFSELRTALLTQTATPRKNYETLARKRSNESEKRYLSLCERIITTENALAEQKAYAFNRAAFVCGLAYLEHYQNLKRDHGQIDFTDIESRVWQLLEEGDHAEYMQYKLDARYRHILLDEFQDTNPLQWQILKAWLDASEAAGTHPTVFLVGDPKQSIYRFRGAEPRLFDLAAEHLKAHYDACHLTQDESRRCAPAIIEAVNRTLDGQPAFAHFRPHIAHHADLPGRVHILPLAHAPEAPASAREGLRNPLAQPLAEAPAAQAIEAAQLATAIHDLVGRLSINDEQGGARPARYGDIMILARSRTHLAHFEAAFKTAGIPYTTARRGGLLDTLEALDLTALLEFLVMPFADLKLAHVLRTPIVNATDDDLLALAARTERTWWQRLRALVAEDQASPALVRAARLLDAWRGLTDTLPVHDLLDRIYFEGNVLHAYARAAPEAMRNAVEANLLAFIELALKVQGGRYPSLPKFLEELRGLRETTEEESPSEGTPDAGLDSMHIHTVHGAKGLERPIVCLIDTHRRENNRDAYGVLVDWEPGTPAPRHFSFCSVKDERGLARSRYFEQQSAFAETENLNLLYVAMTRAKQYLIVSGSANDKAHDTWYEKLQSVVVSQPLLPEASEKPAIAPAAGPSGLPPAPLASVLNRPQPTGQRKAHVESAAQRRGIALHRILEYLTLPTRAVNRSAVRAELGLDETDFDDLWQEASSIVTTAALVRFFDPAHYLRALNELPYVDGESQLRRIDRLVEFDDAVWILDYKMGEAVEHADLARSAARYRKQMDEYRMAMKTVFPGKPIRCALIFSGGRLYDLSE